jgi:uncharacterized protein (TIGR02001 family)
MVQARQLRRRSRNAPISAAPLLMALTGVAVSPAANANELSSVLAGVLERPKLAGEIANPGLYCHDSRPGLTTPKPRTEGPAAAPRGFLQSLDFSFDVALVSDYRRGGLSRSGHAAAVQAGFDVSEPSGWSVGIWASTIDNKRGSNVELNLYGAREFELGETELTLGAMAVVFPGGQGVDYGVAQSSVSHAIGPVDATLVLNYAWSQASLDEEDNLYVALRARTPIGRLASAPLTLGASVGRAQGHFAIEGTKMDWSLSLTAAVRSFDIGISYVDTDVSDRRGDPTCVLTIAHTF